MASGIYPYAAEAGQSMAEWTQDNLQPLIDKYNEYLVSVGKSYAITLNGQAPTIRGFLSQGAIVLATDVWLKLREFAEWVVDEYDVVDNQTGAELGTVSLEGNLPYYSSHSVSDIISNGIWLSESSYYGKYWYIAARSDIPVLACVITSRNELAWIPLAGQPISLAPVVYETYTNYGGHVFVLPESSGTGANGFNRSFTYNGITYHSVWRGIPEGLNPAVPRYATYEQALDDVYGKSRLQGITADTTTLSIPAALPEGTSWGGLAVEGVGDVATPQAVEDAIADAVTAREQPVVQPVTITLAPDTEINPDNGDTDPPPVVITPFPPADPSAVELGQEILESFEAHFPFSVPWDLYKIFSRLDAEPVAPSWTLALPQVGDLEPVSIVIDVANTPYHALAPTFRAFVGIVICLGLLIAATKWIKR